MPHADAGRWWLRALHAEGAERSPRQAIGADGLTLGRAPGNDVEIDADSFPHVSAHHARIVCDEDGQPALIDLDSLNGTWVNEQRHSKRPLRDGDVIRLGRDGPSFVVETDGHAATVMLDPEPAARRGRELSQTTVLRFRRAIGLPEDVDVGTMVQSTHRSARRLVTGLALVLAAAVAVVLWLTRASQQRELARLEGLNDTLQQRLHLATDAFDRQRDEWEQQKAGLERERANLRDRIQALAQREESSATELASLRRSFADTTAALERYNPVNLEAARLQRVQRVQQAVVFIETRLRFRSTASGKLLRQGRSEDEAPLSFDESRAAFERESSGSGFCVSADGWIISNRHVVHPKGHDQPLRVDEDEELRPELSWTVLFSGSDQRHEARVVKTLDGDDDLSLLKIEPFEGITWLDDFATDTPQPRPGAEVYLHGFPLGRMAIQDGNRVVASSFRGILSRVVASWVQVDAAVHPGNSGGPLTDGRGRVIGVVCRVQRISEEALAPDMGYAIPVARVAQLWPPGD